MYRLKRPTNKQLNDYYKLYSPRIQQLMKLLADGTQTIPIALGYKKPAVHLTLQVQQRSPTWQFLAKYSQEDYLRKLLCGDWNDHLEIINEVSASFPQLSWQKGMLKGDYDDGRYQIYGKDVSGKEIVEDFNEIMHWLFVEEMYDGKNSVHLDKTAFIRERGMEVCPYCGRQNIDFAEVNDSISKPYIDHFLPKRKYPFLAMSYMNMVPGCNTCNESTNKGALDPLTHPDLDSILLNPYEFRDNAVTFGYIYNHQGENDEHNFKVVSMAETELLDNGYLKKLKLREFYSHQRLQVKDVYRNFTKATGSMKKFLMRLGLNQYFINNLEQRTLGYNLNDDETPRRQWYKFRKDLFLQLRREHDI